MTSWLTVTLRRDGNGTTLELVHEAPVDPDMWAQFGPGAVGVGWDLGLLGLELHLAGGEQVDAEAALAFPTTPAGRDFVHESAASWADAAVADGDEPTAAHEAADRTVGFYTGTAEEPPGDE